MKIVIKTVSGGVAVMTLIGDADAAECIEKWQAVHPGEYISHREMDDSAIPTDRTFRGAWADVTPEAVIDIDMPAAREIHKDALRALRAPKFAALDVAYNKADELGDGPLKAKIAEQKQTLRDVTDDPAIGAAATPEALKAVVPGCLL